MGMYNGNGPQPTAATAQQTPSYSNFQGSHPSSIQGTVLTAPSKASENDQLKQQLFTKLDLFAIDLTT